MQDQDMLNDLIVESREHIEAIEPDLLELEEKGKKVSEELINRVFRAVHSIKGGFGFFGIENIVKLSHAMENIISKIRDKNLAITQGVIDALLQGIDKLRILLDDVAGSDTISIDEEVALLSPFLGEPSPETEKSTSNEQRGTETEGLMREVQQSHPDLGEEHMLDAVRNGMLMYHVIIDPQKDVAEKKRSFAKLFEEWEKFGAIVDSKPPCETLIKKKKVSTVKEDISLVFTTVLEPDLIHEALQVPVEQIYSVDLSAYKKEYHAQQDAAEKKQKKSVKTDSQVKQESRIEEALRVKVSLLNNLMNFAGELVLARNQLIQTMNLKISENQEMEKAVKAIMDIVRHFSLRADEGGTAALESSQKDRDMEMAVIENKIKDSLGVRLSDFQGIKGIVQNIDMVTTMLQESIMQTRMQPISVVFSKFPRVIRDLAKKLGKEIGLTQIGQEVELDKSIIELLSDPLTHLIRNSVDHGVELPKDRKMAGKGPKGEVLLRAYQEGGKVIIDIEDDGVGINTAAVKAQALDKGIINKDEADTMTEKEVEMLIFAPGFSTAKVVSDVSGRGVGMDVVKTNIERLGGTIEVDSQEGKGTKISLKLPLTLAIIPSLIVTAEERRFAVPQVGLEEVVRIRARDVTSKIERVHNAEVLRLRGKLLPLVRLSTVLGLESTFDVPGGDKEKDNRKRWSDRRGKPDGDEEAGGNEKRSGKKDRRESVRNAVKVIVLKMENKLYGLVVDDVQDSEEIVVKPLPDYLKASRCYAGATIMGDGKVAMILDPNGIAEMADLKFDTLEKEIAAEKKRIEKEERKLLENMLLFSIGGKELFAVDLSRVSRIEKRRVDEIEQIGNKEFLKYDDSSMRLFRIENYLPVQPPSKESENIFVIVPKDAKYPLGIVTSRVEDTVETELVIDADSVKGVGLKGSAIIDKRMAVVLDVPAFLQTVESEFE